MLKQLLFVALVCLATSLSAQQFPTPTIATVAQEPVELSDYVGKGKPTVIAIWATWCQPCHVELDHMKSYLDKWENDYGATVLAISVDKRHTARNINRLVTRKGWEYDILLDADGKLQAKLGFNSIPQMYVLDGDGKIIETFTGYQPGREHQVDRLIKKLSK